MRKQKVIRSLAAVLSLVGVATAEAQSGAYFNAVTNLNPVLYFPLTETTQPPATKPAAANLGSLGSADNGTYTDGAFPGVPGALTGDADTGGLFSGATGVSPRMFAPYDTNYAWITNFTVELWVKSPTNDPPTQCLVNCLDVASPRHGWLIYADGNSAGTFNFRTYYGNGTSIGINYNIPVPGGHIIANTWYHVAVSFNAVTATAQGYVDGQPALSTNTTQIYEGSTAGPFAVGARGDASFAFPGYIDEVAFYPSVLAGSDISNHYAAGTNGPTGAYSTLVTADSPLLYYRFDEAAAPVAKNYGSAGALANGYYETGTLPGAQPGPNFPGMGGASSVSCQFNSSESSDIGPSIPVVGATGLTVGTATNDPMTVAAWVQTATPAFFTTVLGKGDQAYRFDIDGSGDPHFNVGNNSEIVGATEGDSAWHFWVGTWDGTNVVNLYIDGTLVATATGNLTPNGNLQPFLIGTAPDDTGRNFDGNLCQVAVFSNALTQAQVQDLYFSVGSLAPVISQDPQNSVVIVNSNITFTVVAAGDVPLSYQWSSNSVVVAGATNSSLTVSNVPFSANGATFSVTVTDVNALTAFSQPATLNVISPLPGTYFSSVVGLNPLAYYPLNETNQPSPVDYALNIGTLGAAGNALFNAVTGFQQPGLLADTIAADTNFSISTAASQVEAPYSLALSNEPPFTAEIWLQSGAIASEQCPISLVDAGGTRSGWLIYMDATAAGVYQFRAYNKNGATTSIALAAATAINAGETHYLAVVVTTNTGSAVPNASGIYPANSISAYFYLDGQLSASTTNGAYAMDDGADAGGFSMGARSDNSFNFTGEIDEVAYYTNALSATVISNHYAAGTNTTPAQPYYQLVQQSAPLLFYQLDEAAPNYPSETTEPVATNYGINGANDNGYYLPGAMAGAVPGPHVGGFPATGAQNVATAFNHLYASGSPAAGYVDVPNGGSDLNMRGPMTMAAWIKATPNDGRFQTFMGHSDASYRMDIDTTMNLHYADANSAGDLTGSVLNDGNWHFVVGTYDGAHEYLYIDGLQNATQPATGLATGSPDDFTIGVDPQYVTSRMFDGDITQVALFNYGLTGPQVLSLFYAAGVPPIITQEPPAAQTIGNGSSGTITVAAYGTPSLGYQWYKGSSPVSGAEFAGANSSALTINNASPADGGSYSLVITNNYGSVTSSATVVTISQVPVITPTLPATNHILAGTTLTLSVGEIGSSPFTNAWYLNGVLLTNGGAVSGATTTTLTITNAGPAQIGTYTFWVTNAFGKTNTSGYVIVDSGLTFDDSALGWTVNNNGVSGGQGAVAGNVLTLTDGRGGEITSFFYSSPMWIHAFKASYTYTDVGGNNVANGTADGFAFVIQNSAAGSNALQTGGGGSGLGYYQLTNSVELAAELYANNGDNAPGIDVATNGEGSTGVVAGTGFIYGSTTPVSIISGDPIDFSIYYDGSNYSITMTDETTAATYSTNYGVGPIWGSDILDSDTAYVGFTAATGGVSSTQTIAKFYFTPIISLGVSSSPGSVTLTWPTGVGGYTLQSSPSLSAPTWTTIPGPYSVVGSQYQYVASSASGTLFYRLVVLP